MKNRVVKPDGNRRPWLIATVATLVVVVLILASLALAPSLAGNDLPRKALETLVGDRAAEQPDAENPERETQEASVAGEPEFPDPGDLDRPLAVRSNEALLELARDHGQVGSGTTKADPVVLDGALLAQTSMTNLEIENTSLHLLVKGLELEGKTGGVAVSLLDAANVTLEDLRLTGYHTAVKAVGSNGLRVENSTFEKNSRTILLEGAHDARIEHNRFLDNGHAVFVRADQQTRENPTAGRALVFTNNEVERTVSRGTDTQSLEHQASALILTGTGHEVVGNNFTGHSPSAIRINATNVLIQANNFIEGQDKALSIAHSTDTTIIENRFVRNLVAAIFTTETTDTTIQDNVFERNPNGALKGVRDENLQILGNDFSWSEYAVAMWGAKNPVFSHNSVEGGKSGLRAMQSTGVKVHENEFDGTWQSSVVFFDGQDHRVTQNRFVDGRSGGVYLSGVKRTLVEENLVHATGHGFVVKDGSKDVDIRDNELSQSGNVGIRISGGEGIRLEDNLARDLDYAVLVETENVTGVTIQGGELVDNHAGLSVIETAQPVKVHGTTITGNWVGVTLDEADGHLLTGLDVSDNDRAIFLRRAESVTLRDSHIEDNGLGLYLVRSTENLVYNNVFNNVYDNAWLIKSPDNAWNTRQTAGPNIVGGPWIAGNLWHDYIGADADLDGIGEVPHQPIPYHSTLELLAYEFGLPMGPFDLRPLVK